MRVCIYTRVSSRMQVEDGNSLDAQKSLLLNYCKIKQWEVKRIYTDEGLSAKNLKRSGFQEMLNDSKKGLFDAIVVWKLSRFSRSLIDLVNVVDELKKSRVDLISYSENVDLSTAVGMLMFNIVGSFAEFERETISENMKMSIEQAVYKGRRNISHCFGYFVEEGEFVVNEEEKKIINEIYDHYLITENVAETTRYVQSKGYKGRRGNLLSYNSVHVILRNVIYVGYSCYKGVIPFKHKIVPQIVDDMKFDSVQRILIKRCPRYCLRNNVRVVEEWLNS